MNVRQLRSAEEVELESFVAKHPYGSIEQTWLWGEVQTTIPGRDEFFSLGVFKDDELVASMLVIRQGMGHNKHWLWCPRGPLLPKKNAAGAWKLLQKRCAEIAENDGDIYLRVEPGVPADEKWVVSGKATKESYLPEDTLTIDLSQSEDSILAQMTQKGRYNIRKAEKAGVYVRKSNLTDYDDFYDMFEETAKRDGFHLHSRKFYEQFIDLLEGKAKLYLAKIDHELIAGMLMTEFGNTCTYYFGASSNKHRQAYAPYALQWFAMQEAKRAGCKKYDFLGVAPEGDTKHTLAGVTQFKTRFGGERVKYHKAQVFVYRPFWYWLMRVVKSLKP